MFNHGQGVVTSQTLHMQRLMANRPHRGGSAFYGSGDVDMANSSVDPNDQYSVGVAQHNFGTFEQQNHMMTAFSNRSTVSDMGTFPIMIGQNCSMGGSSSRTASANGGFFGGLGTRIPIFKCPECGIVKNSNEDLEVHIKIEHLHWMPFQCPICAALRPSDLQMREHIHSSHKKSENKYIYVDNPQAKGMLQEMIDKAIFGAVQFVQQQMSRRGGAEIGAQFGGDSQHQMTKRARLDVQTNGGDRRLSTVLSIRRVGDEVMSTRNQSQKSSTSAPKEGDQLEEAEGRGSDGSASEKQKPNETANAVDEETDVQLSTIFGRKVKSEFDMAAGCSPETLVVPDEDEDNLPDDNSHQMNALQNVSAMFSASGGSSVHQMGGAVQRSIPTRPMQTQHQQQLNQHGFYRRVVRNRPGPMTSKKRVLGLCAECEKPITAGARQMHMFYHLGKDANTYRFRCKHPGCNVQHYRKDQMENHQSKAHGKVDADMMEDRSMELYNMVQEMSMQLLGTTGNTPGPTAGKAQQIYEQQMREMEANLGVRKRRRPEYFGCNLPSNNNNVSRSSGLPIYDSANRRVEDLECRLCNKFILNRIKGFHILWHLNTDLGIVRYGCKHCNFKHDRPQSVVAHGMREHCDEMSCEDLLYNYEDELKQMSKACFGVERLFEKEIRRRNRLQRFARCSTENSSGGRAEEDDNAELGNNESKQSQQLIRRRSQQHIMNLRVPLKPENMDRDWTPKEPVRKRRSGGRRFFGSRGRKPMTRKARDVMIKLREVSMRLGGAQYFKKRSNEAISCEKCGKLIVNRLSDHAYSHLEGCDLFKCQQCNLGHYSRETIVRHLKDFHNSPEAPMDNRLRFAQEIKDSIRECYPQLFIDAPIPTKEDIEKLRESLNLSDQVLVCDKDEEDEGEHEEDEEMVKDNTNEDEEEDGEEEKEQDGEEEEKEGGEDEAEQQSNANDEEEGEVTGEEEEEDDEEGQDEGDEEEPEEGEKKDESETEKYVEEEEPEEDEFYF